MARNRRDVLLLDLGGVLLQVDGMPAMRSWTALPDDEIWRRWLASPSVRRFESGRSHPTEFASAVVEEFGIDAAPDEFLLQFEGWCRAPHPGAADLLAELNGRYRLACLSNTNAVHWEHVRRETSLLETFHDLFPSHETGHVKPDAEAFVHAVDALGVEPEQVVFFDDNRVNAEAARSVGLEAHVVRDTEALRQALAELGLT